MFLLRIALTALLFYAISYILPSITIDAFWPTAVVAGLVFWLLSITIKPLLKLITLPITILTLGLFLVFINAFVFWAVSYLVPGFYITSFWGILLGTFFMSFGLSLINLDTKD